MTILDVRAKNSPGETSIIYFTDAKYVRYNTDKDVVISDNMLGTSMILTHHQVQDMIEALQLALKYWRT